jgi:hypothetical protein
MDTITVATDKLIGSAICAATFIRAVGAIVLVVADQIQGDTRTIAAGKLIARTTQLTAGLIRAVGAVGDSVTDPMGAGAVGTTKLGICTVTTAHFIVPAVRTVDNKVADLVGRDTGFVMGAAVLI